MQKAYKILVINPGSTSTKIAIFENENKLFEKNLTHDAKMLSTFDDVMDQFEFRKQAVLDYLDEIKFDKKQLDGVATRSGAMYFVPESGAYYINDLFLQHSSEGINGKHPSSLGPHIGKYFSDTLGIPAYIVDPELVDEMCDVARVTGLPGIQRKSRLHALNSRAVARKAASALGKTYETARIIVAHTGGGSSISTHCEGKIIDVAESQFGDGPFSTNRCGAISSDEILEMCFSGKYTKKQMIDILTKTGGLIAHLGTSSVLEAQQMAKNGDKYADLVLRAFYYQIGKNIGAYAAVLKGKVDAIVLTGGIANSKEYVDAVTEMVGFIAPIILYPGEFEMEAMALGCLKVLRGEEKPKTYVGEQDFNKIKR